jgi:hypothetical protein
MSSSAAIPLSPGSEIALASIAKELRVLARRWKDGEPGYDPKANRLIFTGCDVRAEQTERLNSLVLDLENELASLGVTWPEPRFAIYIAQGPTAASERAVAWAFQHAMTERVFEEDGEYLSALDGTKAPEFIAQAIGVFLRNATKGTIAGTATTTAKRARNAGRPRTLTKAVMKKRRKLVEDHATSGLSVRAFCEGRRIEVKDFNSAKRSVERESAST